MGRVTRALGLAIKMQIQRHFSLIHFLWKHLVFQCVVAWKITSFFPSSSVDFRVV